MATESLPMAPPLAERHGLEKIKTIGDAYMVAGGVPEPHPDALGAAAEMALASIRIEVELGFDAATAFKETQRCLNCDVQTSFTQTLASGLICLRS